MRPFTTSLCAQLDHALAAAECAGMARARECIAAAIKAEFERRMRATATAHAAFNAVIGELPSEDCAPFNKQWLDDVRDARRAVFATAAAAGAMSDALDLIRTLDIAMPPEGT